MPHRVKAVNLQCARFAFSHLRRAKAQSACFASDPRLIERNVQGKLNETTRSGRMGCASGIQREFMKWLVSRRIRGLCALAPLLQYMGMAARSGPRRRA